MDIKKQSESGAAATIDDDGPQEHFWSNDVFECVYGDETSFAPTVQKELEHILNQRDELKQKSWAKDASGLEAWLSEKLKRLFAKFVYCAKHKHFHEEKEWRLVVTGSHMRVCYRVGQFGLTPFVETEPLPIHSVWVGPQLQPPAVDSVRAFLISRGNDSALVEHWTSSLRG